MTRDDQALLSFAAILIQIYLVVVVVAATKPRSAILNYIYRSLSG